MSAPYLDRLGLVGRDYGDEQVLCVARAALFPEGAWEGLRTQGIDEVLGVIRRGSEFRARALAEDDPSQQQIVPYCVVEHGDGTYLLTRRLLQGSEERLHHRCSLGVGGHVNPPDAQGGDPVIGGLTREWSEEIVCPSAATARLVGVINDDTTPVSQVHVGLVFIIQPDHGMVSIREHHKLAGESLRLDELRSRRADMETWSQLILDDLLTAPAPAPQRAYLTARLPPSDRAASASADQL